MLIKYPQGFWWADTSVRWRVSDVESLYRSLEAFSKPIMTFDFAGHSIFAATDPLMYKYLSADEEQLKKTHMWGATMMLISKNKSSVEALKW